MNAPPPPRILVVDDEPGIQHSARRILSRRYEVRVADSGAQALQILAETPHDLAIVDVRMPGMNGFEVLKSIKSLHPGTEVIIMTGSISNPEEKLVEAIRARAFYFINKPFEKAVLETLVERCLERQRLERQNRAYTQELEEDLEKARSFQRLLLPSAFPRLAGLRGDVAYEPSERLGGDFYEFFQFGPAVIGVLIADVSGHGVSAALYTGMLKSEIQAVVQEWPRLEDVFGRINDRLEILARSRYVTGLLLELDLDARRARYVNAGHPGFMTRDGHAWESTGTPLGMLPRARYEVREFALPPHERFLLYSDGLSEAMQSDGSDFGVEGLRRVFLESLALPPDEAVSFVLEKARRFSGRPTFLDDATAIVLQLET